MKFVNKYFICLNMYVYCMCIRISFFFGLESMNLFKYINSNVILLFTLLPDDGNFKLFIEQSFIFQPPSLFCSHHHRCCFCRFSLNHHHGHILVTIVVVVVVVVVVATATATAAATTTITALQALNVGGGCSSWFFNL